MTIERKFIDLKDLKVSDEGPGTIEGYRSVFNVIDEGGDLIIPGAFKDTLAEYMESGFTAHSHDWDFDKAVGYPVEAHEDEHGWFVKSEFHSTPDAQNVRTKARERMKAGKKVGFSFGYAPKEFIHIDAKDYEKELANYVKAEMLQETLAKAQKFNRVRILKKVEAIEDSLVTAPMNKRAAATAVKDSNQTKTECDCSPESDANDCPHLKSLLEKFSLKEIPVSESFESFDKAVSAIEKNIAKMRSFHDTRTKEGRVLSSSNRTTVKACRDSLAMFVESAGALMPQLDDLLAVTEPKPKEKEIDVESLRTQSLRAQSQARLALIA